MKAEGAGKTGGLSFASPLLGALGQIVMDGAGKKAFELRQGERQTMKLKTILGLVAIGATLAGQTGAQTYDTNGIVVQTFAGSGFSGYVDGVGQETMFNSPGQIVADSLDNLFVWDGGNQRIRKITPDGTVSTFVGGGNQGLPGYGTNVYFVGYALVSMTIDHSNALWMRVYHNGGGLVELLRIRSDAYVSSILTFAQNASSGGVCADSGDNIYYSDSNGNKIYRRMTNGAVVVFAGSGNPGYADGNGIFTAFDSPTTLAADAADNIYVWEVGNRLIRRIDQSQNVTTFAGKYQFVGSSSDGVGTNAAFSSISQMCADSSGNLILACDSCVRKISAITNATTIAGSFSQTGYANGAGNLARFSGASGVCIAGGTIYVADSSNQRIRSITNNPTAEPVLPANLQLNTYPGLQIVGTVGRTYQVQSSPDMTNWTTQATLLLNSSPFLWIDQTPVSGNKLYRALLLP